MPSILFSYPFSIHILTVRSNLSVSPSPPAIHQQQTQMTTQEVLCQIFTFIAAGHETTASALTWSLYALARDQRAQQQLRLALRELESEAESESAEDDEHALTARIMRCTYLDWVVREALRLHAPVTSTMRVCSRPGGDCIPLSRPLQTSCTEKECKGDCDELGETTSCGGNISGEHRWSVRIAEGDIISLPIQAVNRCKQFWGEDADEFRFELFSPCPS